MKTPTKWAVNSTKNADAIAYSDATVTYSQANQDYVSPTVGQNEQNKPSTSWVESPSV